MASPLMLGRVASMAVTFALPLCLARLLDAAAFGAYKQLFLVAQTALLACQLGLTQSLYYFVPREPGRQRGAYVAQALAGIAMAAVVVAGLLAVGGPSVVRHLGSGELRGLSLPLALIAGSMLLSAPLEPALTSQGRVGTAGLVYVLSDGSRALLLLAGARWGGLAGVAWAATEWGGLRIAALGGLIALGVIPIARPSRARLREQLAYALPFAGSVWLVVAQRQLSQYAVAVSFDAATFALFAVAAFHMPVIDIVHSPISEVLMVQLGREGGGNPERRLAAWDDAVEKMATLLLPATACAWLFGPKVLPLLFTRRYDAAVPLFMIATLEIPLWVLPVDALLRAAGRTRFLLGWYGVRIVITALLVLGGMRLFGVAGAIAGGVAAEAISRIVMAQAGSALLGVSLRRVVNRTLVRIAIAASLAAVPGWIGGRLAQGRASVITGGAMYCVAYALLYVALRRPSAQRASLAAA